MISVVILGTGNLAMHLTTAFTTAVDSKVLQVFGRNRDQLKLFEKYTKTTTDIKKLAIADVYIIAISDDAIGSFSKELKLKNKLVVHTSGSVAIDALENDGRIGVFYPVQTFSKDRPLDFKTIPICIEAEEKEDLLLLDKLARTISDQVYFIDSGQRKNLHIAAVFANNFVNHMYKTSFDLCVKHDIPPEIVYPLILETAEKATKLPPSKIQTGPAKRNDIQTIESHLKALTGEQRNIYKLLTETIQKSYGKKL